jgi:hypothetical protein
MSRPLDWTALRQAPDDDARHLRALLKAVFAKTAHGWKHHPLRVGGNFLSERWMKGQGDVLNGHFMDAAGSAWYQIQALHYDLPDAFGCLLSVGENPLWDGIGLRFWYCSGGKTIVGDGADLGFTIWSQGRAVAKLPLLRVPVLLPEPYEVEEAPATRNWKADLPSLAQAQSFRSAAAQRYDKALAEFRQALTEGRVKKRVYGQYHNDGIPPDSHLDPITAGESEQLSTGAEGQIARQKTLLAQHGQEMFDTFHQVVPLKALTD